MVKEEERADTSPEEPSSPACQCDARRQVFTALASAFGLAIGELALVLDQPAGVDLALREAEVAAKATLLSASGRSIR